MGRPPATEASGRTRRQPRRSALLAPPARTIKRAAARRFPVALADVEWIPAAQSVGLSARATPRRLRTRGRDGWKHAAPVWARGLTAAGRGSTVVMRSALAVTEPPSAPSAPRGARRRGAFV